MRAVVRARGIETVGGGECGARPSSPLARSGLLAGSCAALLDDEEDELEASVTIRDQSGSAVKIRSFDRESFEVLVPAEARSLARPGGAKTRGAETFPCCRVNPGASRTVTFNAVTTPAVQFRAGRDGNILGTPITCTFGAGTAPRVVYTSSGLTCQGW